MMDDVEASWGDKPYFGSMYSVAGADSAMGSATDPSGGWSGTFTTQAARGAAYYTAMQNILTNIATSTGNHPYIGMGWYQMYDSWQGDYGMITPTDNAYDGHEAVTAAVPCSVQLSKYKCGGERANYGDLISSVAKANMLWLDIARRQIEKGNTAKTKPR
jgi:hypothetical protein